MWTHLHTNRKKSFIFISYVFIKWMPFFSYLYYMTTIKNCLMIQNQLSSYNTHQQKKNCEKDRPLTNSRSNIKKNPVYHRSTCDADFGQFYFKIFISLLIMIKCYQMMTDRNVFGNIQKKENVPVYWPYFPYVY